MPRDLLACVALLALAGCGGGGGSPSAPPTATPSPSASVPLPSPTPSPAPAPAPSPSAVNFVSLGVSGQRTEGNDRQVADAVHTLSYSATLTDPDAPSATRIEDINFDGDEALIVQNTTAIGSYNEAFVASDYAGAHSNNRYFDTAFTPRVLPIASWQSRLGSGNAAQLVFRELEEVRKTATTAQTTGDRPEHVRLFELRLTDRRSIQLFGSRTPASSVPSSGAAIFAGEVFGTFVDSSGRLEEFVGDAVISVDYARGTLSGQITASQVLFSPQTSQPIQIQFTGTISGETFVAQTVTASGPQLAQTGTLAGAFFGSSASEIGVVLSTRGASGTIIAGLVAGKE